MRAQIAMEFLTIVMVAMLMLVGMLFLMHAMTRDYAEEKNIARLQDLGYSIQAEIILASQVNPGYVRQFTVPSKVIGEDYTLSSDSKEVSITYRGSEIFFAIPQVSGTITEGKNTIRKIDEDTILLN